MIAKKSISICCMIALAGCMGKTGSIAWYNDASQAERTAYFTEQCLGYGFKRGTTEMAQCVQNENLSARKRSSDFNDRISENLRESANSMPTYTSCNSYGGYTSCTSY